MSRRDINAEESKKDTLAFQADEDLRDIPVDAIERFLKWWNYWRPRTGWRRLSKVVTAYAKELKAIENLKEREKEKN